MARRQHRNSNQGSRADRTNSQQSPRTYFLQKCGADETADHRDAQAHIGRLDGRCFMQAISLQSIGRQRAYVGNGFRSCTENQQATEKGARKVPSELKACVKFKRLEAVRAGPSTVT